MIILHPSLWLKFQREFINKLYTYKEKSEELLYPVANQQLFSAPQLQFSVQHISAKPFPGRPPVLHRQTQCGNHLLSSGYNRPTVYVCVSHNPVWVQAQMPTYIRQQWWPVDRLHPPYHTKPLPAPLQSADQSFNLSSMKICNTSIDRVVVAFDEFKESEKQ